MRMHISRRPGDIAWLSLLRLACLAAAWGCWSLARLLAGGARLSAAAFASASGPDLAALLFLGGGYLLTAWTLGRGRGRHLRCALLVLLGFPLVCMLLLARTA